MHPVSPCSPQHPEPAPHHEPPDLAHAQREVLCHVYYTLTLGFPSCSEPALHHEPPDVARAQREVLRRSGDEFAMLREARDAEEAFCPPPDVVEEAPVGGWHVAGGLGRAGYW